MIASNKKMSLFIKYIRVLSNNHVKNHDYAANPLKKFSVYHASVVFILVLEAFYIS